jgi:signal transduction histidine kinase
MKYFISQTGRKAAIAVLIGLGFVLAFFVILSFFQIGIIYWVYATVETWVTSRLGFDYYLASLVATTISIAFTLSFPVLAWYLLLGKKKVFGIGIIVGLQFIVFASVYTVGSDVCFDRRTGEPYCYFADTPDGRVWSRTPGFDPASGKPFSSYTREVHDSERGRNDRQAEKTHQPRGK